MLSDVIYIHINLIILIIKIIKKLKEDTILAPTEPGLDWQKDFQQLTPSEFFRKNKQMLGFTGKIRSLTIVFHELITNSFDAAEEAGILPDIDIELKRVDKEHYILRHKDNGPGIPEDYVMQVYCSMFAGSKFRNIQSRGQQGLGCSGCVLLSQMTTGKPARVISCYKDGDEIKGVKMKFQMDVKHNTGILMEREDYVGESTGVCIELQFKDVSYSMAEQGAFEYIRRTMIGNPHAKITFRDPTGHKYIFKRAADIVPTLPKEVLPHPKGVSADDLMTMAKNTDKRRYKSMLTASMSRMSNKRAAEITEMTGIDMNKRPKDMTFPEAEAIVQCFKKMKFMAPPTDGLIPIGENTPLTLFVNIISTQVPYLSTGKQSVSPEPEIVQEIRQATMKLARQLQKHLRAKRAAKEKEKRSKVFEEYVPVIIEEAAKLGETGVPEYQEVLAKVTKRALAELLGEKVEDEVEEEELDAIIMEELDERGYAVDEEHSNLNFEEDENEEEFEE